MNASVCRLCQFPLSRKMLLNEFKSFNTLIWKRENETNGSDMELWKPLESVNLIKLYTKARWILFSWCRQTLSYDQSELLRKTAIACANLFCVEICLWERWIANSLFSTNTMDCPQRTHFIVKLLSLPRLSIVLGHGYTSGNPSVVTRGKFIYPFGSKLKQTLIESDSICSVEVWTTNESGLKNVLDLAWLW